MNIENALELFYLKFLSALFFNRPFYCTAERLLSGFGWTFFKQYYWRELAVIKRNH